MKISFQSTDEEKSNFLKKIVFNNIDTLQTGRLTIKKRYLVKVADMLGGDYNKMTKVQKFIFCSDLLDERIYFDTDISRYYLF